MPVRDRQEMFSLFTERMSGAYDELRATQRLEQRTTLVKSYVIEAHHREVEDGASAWMSRVLGETHLGSIEQPAVTRTEDPHLFTVEARTRSGPVLLYVDTADSRYWFAHSLSGSTAVDQLIDRLTRGHAAIDRAWFPADLLERVSGLGSFRGLGLDFDRRPLGDLGEDEAQVQPVEFLKMQLWGTRADAVLDKLREVDAFPGQTTLSKVRVKYWLSEGDSELFAVDDVKWDGKTTARGTSFDSHNDLLTTVARAYEGGVRRIETEYAIRPDGDGDAARFTGAPLVFAFANPIENLDRFSAALFSGRDPFRLWGTPIRVTDSQVRAHVVDLHIGAPMSFEVMRDFMRVYIPSGTCGNSVFRLYANLQHYYDAQVRALDPNGESAVAVQP